MDYSFFCENIAMTVTRKKQPPLWKPIFERSHCYVEQI